MMRAGVGLRAGWLVAALLCLAPSQAAAELEFEFGGFAQVNYGSRVTDQGCAGRVCDLILGEERLQLKLEASTDDGRASFKGKVDFWHDAIFNQVGLEAREIYLDLAWKYVTLRMGRQIITWGVGDLLFINDIFPRDWVAFFTGRPLQYLKVGSDAIKLDFHPRFMKLELVVMPFFAPDRVPTGQRLLVSGAATGFPIEMEQKDTSWVEVELAARLSTFIRDWELAGYAAHTFYRSPAFGLDDPQNPTAFIGSYPRLNIFGLSASGALLGGVLSVEAAYYDSEDDRDGDKVSIENSQLRGLLSYSHPLWRDATLSLQGYAEWMQNYDSYELALPVGAYKRDEFRVVTTLRFRQMLFHQTLTFNLFAYFGVTELDAYIIPSIRYAFADGFWAELGGNIFFADKEGSFFGGVRDNSNVYLTARYSF